MLKPPFKTSYDFSQHHENGSTARVDEQQIAALLEALDDLRKEVQGSREEIHRLGEQVDQERILREQREGRDPVMLVVAIIAAVPGIAEIMNLLS